MFKISGCQESLKKQKRLLHVKAFLPIADTQIVVRFDKNMW